ncbi:MAG: 16S rRNA (cytosine(1402)-N(4))-methyltransferase RsmH [Bacteroidota bacterium]
MYHAPVMLELSVDMLRIRPNGVYADATFGGGGHARHILSKLNSDGHLYAFDQDDDARKNMEQQEFAQNPSFHFIQSNFRHLKRQLRSEGLRVGTVDGILADLGVSSYQLDTAERGFSYRFDAELDMRMNTSDGQRASDLLNTYDLDALQRVLGEYGEVRNARTLAQAIIKLRETNPFQTTSDLVDLCGKMYMGDRMRYLSQVFQALRMEVNDELGALRDFLSDSLEMLAPGGRLVVITYHSIEDRLVKNFIKTGNVEGEQNKDFYGNIDRPFVLVNKKAIEPTEEEIKTNTRSRSAQLRVGEKAIPKS